MFGALVGAQLRRVGATAVATPLAAAVVLAALGWVASAIWPADQATLVAAVVDQVLVICVGLCAAVVVTGDVLAELHDATPTPFRAVQFVRAGLVAVAGAAGAALCYLVLHLRGVWFRDTGWASLVAPVGAVLLVVVVALASSASGGAVSAATIAVIVSWLLLAELLPQCGLSLVVSPVLAAVAWRRLGDAERALGEARA